MGGLARRRAGGGGAVSGSAEWHLPTGGQQDLGVGAGSPGRLQQRCRSVPSGAMPQGGMEKFLQIAPHSLAVVLARSGSARAAVAVTDNIQHHHTGYEIFADFKAENMQHFWNKRVTDAISEAFFLGWIDEHVLLIQGKESHLEVLREAWMRRSLKPPRGFGIKYLGECQCLHSV
ncbi:hypothetical protein chiPu_0005375 [Chiloscyllium punctatum]|uniref:Storkhead-box protein 1 n=1 Tax=Chiloscyllium punctatum TaxID=137246 RepID=A0A401S977_CHIPU|nr:hypothetical protein [Chiloscyllium punctatum]